MGYRLWLHCDTVCGGGAERGQWRLLCSLPVFSHSLCYPQSKLGPFSADSRVGGFVYVLGPCGSLQRTLLWGWEFLLLPPQLPQVFSISDLRLYFPTLELWVARSVAAGPPAAASLASCRFAHPTPQSATSLGPPAPALLGVLSTWLPISAPLTSLDECFFFISLVVGLPYSSIFCRFWLFFVFKLLLPFFWVCKEAQCVYLCLHLGRKSESTFLNPQMLRLWAFCVPLYRYMTFQSCFSIS